MAETQAVETQSADSGGGETLDDFLSDAFGELPLDETPGDAGAAPAPDPTATSPAPDGTALSERPAAPTGDAPAPVPDPSTTAPAPAVPDPDPLDGALPFTYKVNGQERSIDGIKVLGEHGGIITKEALPFLQQRFSERDTLYERAREAYEQSQQYEQLMQWATKNPDGTETIHKGLDGGVEMRVHVARLEKENAALSQLFNEPAKLAALLLQDEQGTISIDPDKLQLLALKAAREQDDIEKTVRGVLGQLRAVRPQGQSPQQSNETQRQAEWAPKVIETMAGANLSVLTTQDLADLKALYPRFERRVTAQDRLTQPQLREGDPIVDHDFQKAVDNRIALRKEVATTTAANVTAAQENARKLAAAAVGQKPTVNAPVIPKAKEPTPAQSRMKEQDNLWNMLEDLRSGKAFAKMAE